MKTHELIVRLAAEARPVHRLPSFTGRFTGWLIVAIPVVAVFVLVFGAQAGWKARAASPAFLLSLVTVCGLSVAGAAAALAASVPGDQRSRLATSLTLLLAGAWAVALGARLVSAGAVGTQFASEPLHVACALQITAMAVFPALVLFRSVRAGAPVAPGLCGALTAGAAVAAGAVGSAIVCPFDRAAHELLWHMLPVVVLAAGGTWLGRHRLARLTR